MSVCMSRVVYRIHGGEFGDSSRTVGCVCVCVCVCVWESYIDEPLVGTVIFASDWGIAGSP